MDFLDKQSCTITGHRPPRFKFKYNEQAPLCQKIKTILAEQIRTLYEKGVRVYYVGCAVGVDTWAAEIILDLMRQKEYSEIELFCAIPFPEHTERFTAGQKKRYEKILNGCTDKKTINYKYSPVAYKRCNYFMIDNSQYLIAVYDQDKSQRSGTGQTVNYAIKKGLHITFIHPDTANTSIYSQQ